MFPVIGYVQDGKRIEAAVLIAEKKGRKLRPVGRVEFWTRRVMTPDAREALALLTRSRDRRACYVEPRLLAFFTQISPTWPSAHGVDVAVLTISTVSSRKARPQPINGTVDAPPPG